MYNIIKREGYKDKNIIQKYSITDMYTNVINICNI